MMVMIEKKWIPASAGSEPPTGDNELNKYKHTDNWVSNMNHSLSCQKQWQFECKIQISP